MEKQEKELSFLDRLRIEKSELQTRVEKLEQYITENDHFKSLSEANRALLKNQLLLMKAYLDVLIVRLELLNNNQ